MTPTETLRHRAQRMLHDGLPHSLEALNWARQMLAAPRSVQALRSLGFNWREISLGSHDAH